MHECVYICLIFIYVIYAQKMNKKFRREKDGFGLPRRHGLDEGRRERAACKRSFGQLPKEVMQKNMIIVSCNTVVAKEEQGGKKDSDDSPLEIWKGWLEMSKRCTGQNRGQLQAEEENWHRAVQSSSTGCQEKDKLNSPRSNAQEQLCCTC